MGTFRLLYLRCTTPMRLKSNEEMLPSVNIERQEEFAEICVNIYPPNANKVFQGISVENDYRSEIMSFNYINYAKAKTWTSPTQYRYGDKQYIIQKRPTDIESKKFLPGKQIYSTAISGFVKTNETEW